MHTLITHFTAFMVGVPAGAYCWYRWGSRVKADLNQIRQMKP